MADHLFSPDVPPYPLWFEYDGPLYDGSDWDTFPARTGWLEKSEAGDFPGRYIPYVKLPKESEYFFRYRPKIESWLYFGMLHYVFGDQLDQAEFLWSKDGQKQLLTTRHLHKYVDDEDDWKTNNRGARTVKIVNKVLEVLPRYWPWIQDGACLAIRLLSLALWNVAVKRDGPQPDPPFFGAWTISVANLKDMGLFLGWCPLDVEKCRGAGIQLDTQMYLQQLRRTKLKWNWRTHEACTKTQCVSDNIDKSKYAVRHVYDECSCSHLHADVEQLHTILLDGGIPLVMITPCGEDEFGKQQYDIKIVKKRTNKPYVAISHIWADGLGNPEGNSLPYCQLKFLYERARPLLRDKDYIPGYDEKIYGPLYTGAVRFAHFASNAARRGDDSVLIWIDTLCIPHQSDVRGLAIERIRDVYTNASRTMIIDAELMLVDSRLVSKTEICLRVLYCSSWIRRLWTLQEGLAAGDKLFVLLSDKAINIGTIPGMLVNKVDQGEIPIFQQGIATMAAGSWYSYFQEPTNFASTFHRLVLGSGDNRNRADVISWTWFNVATRASSKDRDRPTVLAGLLNLDVREVLKIKDTDERMLNVYSMLGVFPQDVMFLEGARFEEYGMRWALKTCLFSGEFSQLTKETGDITPRGLQVKIFPSLIALSSDLFDLALAKSKQSDPDQRQMDWAQWLHDSKPGYDCDLEVDSEVHPELDSDHLHGHPSTEPATNTKLSFLHLKDTTPVNLSQGEAHGIILSSASPDQSSTRCALVAIQTNEDGVHYARYLSTGVMVTTTFTRNVDTVELPEKGYLLAGTWGDAQVCDWVVG
ncbi:hypothetical protein BJX76DRAFT_363842 [Aspergillus varians]